MFNSFLVHQSRAVPPDYQSQWRDEVQTFDFDFADWVVEGYPYSRSFVTITNEFDPNLGDNLVTFSGDLIVTFDNQVIRAFT